MSPEFYWIAVAVVTTLSSARLTRLATVDKFPPVVWFRDKYAVFTDTPRKVGWQLLMFCGYCFSFWATALVVAAAWFTGAYDVASRTAPDAFAAGWWLVNGTLAASYAAAVFMAHDGDINDDDEDDGDDS